MNLYSKKDRSIPQKIILVALELIILWASYWILFEGGFARIFPHHAHTGNSGRHLLLFCFNLIVFLRMLVTVFYLVKRRIPWEEAFSIPFAFALYYIGFALLGFRSDAAPGLPEVLAVVLFILGSFLNTGSELARDRWKKHPGNQGKLYTSGLFRYSMHINYFGDILWVTGYAIATRNWYAISIPIFLFCFFAFYNVPKLDQYLAGKYKEQFQSYKAKTRKLLPFIY